MIFLSVDASAPAYIHKLARDISILLAGRRLDTFSVTKLPSAVPAAQIIFIPDEMQKKAVYDIIHRHVKEDSKKELTLTEQIILRFF